MNISRYDSASISTLFSSLNSSRGKAGADMLGINYSDYASLRNGSYGRLLKSYYELDSDKSTTSSVKKPELSSTSKDSAKTLANIEDAAEHLTDTAKELYTRSNNKVFKKDEAGNYDKDAVYNKVSKFVEEYNSLLSAADKSNVNRITNSVSAMKRMTDRQEDSLEKIGITVDSSDGTLSIDKKTFMNADMNAVKDIFQGTGSYAYGVATQASLIDSAAQNEAAKANTYGNRGAYNYNYNSGNIFTDYF